MNIKEIKIGMKDYLEKRVTEEDVIEFSKISLDINPVHLDESYAKKTIFKKRIAHGMLTSSLISAVIGNKLPGEGSIYLKQDLKFVSPVYIGDLLRAEVEIIDIDYKKSKIKLKTTCYSNAIVVVIGIAEIFKMEG